MSEEVSYEVIKSTQDILGKYIKKPPLTEKLLKKPPFRFLHDIVTSVIRETQFLDGIFTDEELKSENIKDKEDKMKFLQKLINAIKLLTESDLSVRPSKIVAGHEPAKTNELLQAIGKALDNNLSSAVLVSQITEGLDLSKQIKIKPKSKPETKVEKSKHKRDITPASRTSLEDKSRKKVDVKKKTTDAMETDNKTTKRAELKVKDKKPKKTISPTKAPEKNISNNRNNILKSQEVPKKRSLEEQKPSESLLESPNLPPGFELSDAIPINSNESNNKNSVQDSPPLVEKEIFKEFTNNSIIETNSHSTSLEKIDEQNNSNMEEMIQLQASDKNDTDSIKSLKDDNQEKLLKMTELNRVPTAKPRTVNLRPPSARPVSARPAAPRVRDRNDVLLPPEQAVPLGKVKVIVENFDKTQEEDDKESLVVVETASIIPDIEPPVTPILKENAQGHLVTQILETQKELVNDVTKSPIEIEWEADGQRIKETKKRYIENIRNKIQTVTRAALPLGQIINFLQEDYDNIMRELQIWRSTNVKLSAEIAQQRQLADKNLEPLQKQYQDIIEDIEKQKTRNDALKSEIFRNQTKIDNVLTTLI